MPALRLHLAATPVHDLRGIASRLGILNRSLRRKTELIDAIAFAWENPATRDAVISTLSTAARGALAHLLRVERTLSALFFAEYGAIHRARAASTGSSPWRIPTSVSDELYYTALVGAFDLKPLRTTMYLCVPSDLNLDQALHAPQVAIGSTDNNFVAPNDDVPVWATAYDVAQWLVFLHEQSLSGNLVFTSSSARWPSVSLMQQLNQRLASPEHKPLARAPSRRNRMRLILFLADAGGLQKHGVITPLGWTWLGEPLEQQTALLWRTWLDASPLVRQKYAFADGLIPKPWPLPLLHALNTLAHNAGTTDLAEHMLQQDQVPAQYWLHQVDSLSALRRLVARVISQVLLPFGIVRTQHHEHGAAYALTFLGKYLLGTDRIQWEFWRPSASPLLQIVDANSRWRISLPTAASVRAQADLAGYAAYSATDDARPHVVQHYQIDDASLARAISAGFEWPGLASILERLELPLDSSEGRQLAHRFTQIPTFALHTRTLLHSERREDIHTLLEHPALRPLIDNLLSATTATLTTTPAEASRRLQAAGYAVRTDDVGEMSLPAELSTSAALWLAGSIYRRLASLLTLPLPLQPTLLDALITEMSPIQRSTLSGFLEQLEATLLDLLDGRIYAPPTFTVDIAAHRTRIETAAALRQPLYIDYFSPGRNVLTRRPIEPFWVEQAGQQLYVRAECLLSGRILLFRLDRIRAIWDTPPELPSAE